MSYKVEKKADGWYVDGERHATQNAATKTLIALLSGKAAPKKAGTPSGAGGAKRAKVPTPGTYQFIKGGTLVWKPVGTRFVASVGSKAFNLWKADPMTWLVSYADGRPQRFDSFEEAKEFAEDFAEFHIQKADFKKSARSGFKELGWDQEFGDLVNADTIEGHSAKVIGTVAHPPKGMTPDVTSILIVEHAAAKGESIRYTVIAFDDEAVYQKDIYRGIPDVQTAEMLAKAAWGGMNHHAGHYTPELLAAQKKYATKTRL